MKVGAGSSIGDGVVVHVAKFAGDLPAIIGNGVNVGPKSVIHACVLEDGCTIGAGSTVLDGARVSRGAILAPGSLAPPRCLIPEGQVKFILMQSYSLYSMNSYRRLHQSYQSIELEIFIFASKQSQWRGKAVKL